MQNKNDKLGNIENKIVIERTNNKHLPKISHEHNNYKLYRHKNIRRMKTPLLKRMLTHPIKTAIGGIVIVGLLSISKNGIRINENLETTTTTTLETTVETTSEITTNDLFSLENRLQENQTNSNFSLGSKVAELNLETYINSDAGKIFIKYGNQFGIDPYLLIAKACQETYLNHDNYLQGGKYYNGHGVGICQLEHPNSEMVIAYNYETNQEEVEYITMDNAQNLDKNIKIAAMKMQNNLKCNNGNIYLTIQSYNYGNIMVDMALKKYSNDTNLSIEEIKNNYHDLGWLKYIYDIHENPSNYLTQWNFKTYGDGEYINHVLRYFPGAKTYYNYNGLKYVVDLTNGDILETKPIDNKIK